MNPDSKIYVAGHQGLVGSAILRTLQGAGYRNLVFRTHAELDLMELPSVARFFSTERPEFVFLSAAKVGGIGANETYPAEFIFQNLAIQTNVIQQAFRTGVKRLLFLGSSCIYPKESPQPIKEEYLLTGPLEPTNRPYAIAKIAGIEMCWAYNRQHGTRYLAVMPCNLYGPGDNYDSETSHVVSALIRKTIEAKQGDLPSVEVWGTGKPRREFLYCDDMADACVFLMNLPESKFATLTESDSQPPLINVGCGQDQTIAELAKLVADAVGYYGEWVFDGSKPDGVDRKLLDVSRITALSWRAKTPLSQGLRLAIDSFLAHQAGRPILFR
jgi:GDP-L-fucose synthase